MKFLLGCTEQQGNMSPGTLEQWLWATLNVPITSRTLGEVHFIPCINIHDTGFSFNASNQSQHWKLIFSFKRQSQPCNPFPRNKFLI